MSNKTAVFFRWGIMLMVSFSSWQAFSIQASDENRVLNATIEEQNITSSALLFREKEAELSFEEVFDQEFMPYDKALIDTEHEVYWIRFTILNETESDATMYTSGFFNDKIDVFRYDHKKDRLIDEQVSSGYLIPPNERSEQYNQSSIVPIYVPANSSDTYLLRIYNYTKFGKSRAKLSLKIGLILYDESTYRSTYNTLTYINMFMMGIILIAILYTSLIFLWTRKKVFGYLAMYSVANFTWIFFLGGMLINFNIISDLDVERHIRQFVPFLIIPVFYTLFCTKFLNLRKHSPRLFYFLWILTGIHTALGIFYAVNYEMALSIQTKISPIIYALFPVSATIAYKKGQLDAGYLIVGSILFFLSVPIYIIGIQVESVNYLDGHLLTQWCFLVEIIIFSVASTKQLKNFKLAQISAEVKAEVLKKELEENSRKLIAYTAERIRHNEELENIKRQIISTENDDSPILKRRIQSLMMFDSNWKNFKLYFENVHPKFFEQLLKLYPNLTPNEERLCAFIKMGLTSKEIASLLGISKRSVDKAKERLKKKMQLDADTSVLLAIKSIKPDDM